MALPSEVGRVTATDSMPLSLAIAAIYMRRNNNKARKTAVLEDIDSILLLGS